MCGCIKFLCCLDITGFFPPNIMLPPKRLNRLLQQAIEMQTEKCNFHCVSSNVENYSLLTDHICTRYSLLCEWYVCTYACMCIYAIRICVCMCSCVCVCVCVLCVCVYTHTLLKLF